MKASISLLIRSALGATAVMLVATSCAPLDVAAPPVSKLTLPKKTDLKKMEEGRQIYAASCTRCHGPARIYKRTDEKWADKILPGMCKKARLTPVQEDALKTYVMTARKALNGQPAN